MTLFDACEKASKLVNGFLAGQTHNDDDDTTDHDASQSHGHDSQIYKDTKAKVIKSYEIIEEALDRFKLEEISVSYNGGKDCLVMLIIMLAVIFDKRKQFLLDHMSEKLNAIFIHTEESFPEMDTFLNESTIDYQLSFLELNDSLKSGFISYLKLKPMVKAVVVGMRRIDPYGGELTYFEKTDHNWPEFMRIHPVLEWEYNEIWCFLTTNKIKYCKLYDLGYTSIGGIHNTIPNPCLLKEGTIDSYYPAWHLKDNDKERLSRV